MLQWYHCIWPQLSKPALCPCLRVALHPSLCLHKEQAAQKLPLEEGTRCVGASAVTVFLRSSHRPAALLPETGTTQQGLEDTSSCISEHSQFCWYFTGSNQLVCVCVSSNPSSLSVHLPGSQDRLHRWARSATLGQPIPEGLHTGTVSRICARWGYRDIKITTWSSCAPTSCLLGQKWCL